jgi:hypothetical protein
MHPIRDEKERDRRMAEVERNALLAENKRLKAAYEMAIDRIKDLLMEEDGYAAKEARKFLERVS